MTARLLGVDDQGNPDPGATPAPGRESPGYKDTWFDLQGGRARAARRPDRSTVSSRRLGYFEDALLDA